MPRNNIWDNPDGLLVGFGTHSADFNVPAVTTSSDSVVTVTSSYNLVDLEDTDLITIASANLGTEHVFPRGSWIMSDSFLYVDIGATSGGAATLDVGFYDATDGTTADDANGLDGDMALSEIDTAGFLYFFDGPLTIANEVATEETKQPLGDTSNSDVVLRLGFEAAVYTAGRVTVVLRYMPPVRGSTVT